MTLNSPVFLFLFLPAFLVINFLVGKRLQSVFLLIASLLFLLWAEPIYFPAILMLSGASYFLGVKLDDFQHEESLRKKWLILGLMINLGMLVGFKLFSSYWQDFLVFVDLWGFTFPATLPGYLRQIAGMPLGLSYITFQTTSYLLDISRRRVKSERNLTRFFNYVLMFPKIVAGPIVRYREISFEGWNSIRDSSQVAAGIRRFMIGFVKKTLIANPLSLVTDGGIFLQPPDTIPTGTAWFVILCFSLQIYYDFAGYTDMAIGLGKVIGFRFPENFDHPYISTSITAFWRRWHITLSNWFRDYVFYPLERKRRMTPWLNQYTNILIVFLLTGFWHGASATFLMWGLIHGGAIALERSPFGNVLRGVWKPLQHAYTLLVVLVAWVFFRSPSIGYAWGFLISLFGFPHPETPLPYGVLPHLSPIIWTAFTLGLIFSLPVFPWMKRTYLGNVLPEDGINSKLLKSGLVVVLFVLGIIVQAGTMYQPFIYGAF